MLQIICFLPENTPKNIKTKKLFAHICGFTDFECGFDLRSLRQREQTGQTDLTFKLDFPSKLFRAAFAILAMFNHFTISPSEPNKFPAIEQFSALLGYLPIFKSDTIFKIPIDHDHLYEDMGMPSAQALC